MITFESFELFSILMTTSAASLNLRSRRAPDDYNTSGRKNSRLTFSASETNRLLVRNDYADINYRLTRQLLCSKFKDFCPALTDDE
jgi:hypothetical protein